MKPGDDMRAALLATTLLFAHPTAGAAAAASPRVDGTTAGTLEVDPPTLIALGFAWHIEGDDNRNAKVTIEYRRDGEAAWSRGLDLLRTQREEMFLRGAYDVTLGNLFAGSILDLQEATPYQVRLTLTDPDGVTGDSVREL